MIIHLDTSQSSCNKSAKCHSGRHTPICYQITFFQVNKLFKLTIYDDIVVSGFGEIHF